MVGGYHRTSKNEDQVNEAIWVKCQPRKMQDLVAVKDVT